MIHSTTWQWRWTPRTVLLRMIWHSGDRIALHCIAFHRLASIYCGKFSMLCRIEWTRTTTNNSNKNKPRPLLGLRQSTIFHYIFVDRKFSNSVAQRSNPFRNYDSTDNVLFRKRESAPALKGECTGSISKPIALWEAQAATISFVLWYMALHLMQGGRKEYTSINLTHRVFYYIALSPSLNKQPVPSVKIGRSS